MFAARKAQNPGRVKRLSFSGGGQSLRVFQDMARVFYIDPISHISGKVCRHTQTIFMHRGDSGTNFTSRICNPHKGNPTDGQKDAMLAFAAAQAKVSEVMSDPTQRQAAILRFKNQTKYKTLRGFIFAENYGQA